MNYEFKINKTTTPKQKPDIDHLEFGTTFTDHMFIMNYSEGKGWHDGRIVPYAPIELDPAAAVLHYAQEMFEGLKAYKAKDGRVLLFRPDMNAKRTTLTSDRICIPRIDEELYVEAIKAVVRVDSDWIPEKEGTSLYIRPFIIASEPFLGVRPSKDTFQLLLTLK
jgi:branched-chain amino acid aminotransferase